MESPVFDTVEQQALNDADFFLTKARIDLKITALLNELKIALQAAILNEKAQFPAGLKPGNGRIYRGEHYGHFPWRALDFPASFDKQDHFAYRTLLLWGHHFSLHLLLSGRWLRHFLPAVLRHLPELAAVDLQLSLQESPWKWEMDASTHLHLRDATPDQLQQRAADHGFLKLSRLHPLSEAATLTAAGLETWQTLQRSLF